MAQHSYRVGEVVHAFNTAQAAFFRAFCTVVAKGNYELAADLWEAQPSDSTQRRLLEIHVKASVNRKAIQRGLLWAISAMNKLSERRNDAVHSNMIWYYDRLAPNLDTKRARAKRIEQTPFESIWKDLRGDLAAIGNYVNDLSWDLTGNDIWPMTKRPRLKLVRIKSAVEQERLRRAKKSARNQKRVRPDKASDE